MPKPLLERRVLGDERIEIYEGGREDIRAGQIDRRVLATLAYLAESGLRPTVTSLKCGHCFFTASGNVSHHSSGNAVDIAAINGVPILGHQEPGGITEQAVRRLMSLQGTMRPDQIISLLDLGAQHHRDGRPRRPHPRGLPAPLRHQPQARPPGPRRCCDPASGPSCSSACARSRTRSCPPTPSRWSIPTRRARRLQRLRELARRDDRRGGGD